MTPSVMLYAEADSTARQADAVEHERDPEAPRVCLRSCRRCRLDARARLFVRAGDSARALEER